MRSLRNMGLCIVRKRRIPKIIYADGRSPTSNEYAVIVAEKSLRFTGHILRVLGERHPKGAVN